MEGGALIASEDCLVWESHSSGEVPEGAVEGGTAEDGSSLFIARAETEEGEISPGKVHAGHENAYIPFNGKEMSYVDYEVLVNRGGVGLQWMFTSGCSVPVGAVQGGYTPDDEPIYIARVEHESGDVIPGKFLPHMETCFIPWGTEEIQYQECEVLCVTTVKPPSC